MYYDDHIDDYDIDGGEKSSNGSKSSERYSDLDNLTFQDAVDVVLMDDNADVIEITSNNNLSCESTVISLIHEQHNDDSKISR